MDEDARARGEGQGAGIVTRVSDMLLRCEGAATVMPPAQLFNEGWLLRLALDWFDKHPHIDHQLAVPSGARWYSEVLMPSPFAARHRGDPAAETHTHADGVIGDFEVGGRGEGDLALRPDATHLCVAEAKLKSGLSKGTRNAIDYDQAARNVACLSWILSLASRRPDEMQRLAFFVLAPLARIDAGAFSEQLAKDGIQRKVWTRARDYGLREREGWLRDWFDPVLEQMEIAAISWEAVGGAIQRHDPAFGEAFIAFYERCRVFNRLSGAAVVARPTDQAPRDKSDSLAAGGEAERLAAFVRELRDFEMVEDLAVPYEHMGATITDAVLQAGLRYESVVWPRVQHVKSAFPEAATTTGFLTVLRARGGEEVVHWTHAEKLGRMEALAELLVDEGVETEADLHSWLCSGEACELHVARLLAVRGMGPKTVDYLKILCGERDTAAIDVHLLRFLQKAGLHTAGYDEARALVAAAAGELGVTASRLDHSIWTYMSKSGRTW